LSRLSDSDRNSTTKSGQRGINPFFCLGVKDSQRSRLTQDRSGERIAPFGSINPVEESNPTPKASFSSHQQNNCPVIRKFRCPDSPPVGGLTINSPWAVRSNFKSRLTTARASNCSRVIERAIALGISKERVSGEVVTGNIIL